MTIESNYLAVTMFYLNNQLEGNIILREIWLKFNYNKELTGKNCLFKIPIQI